MPDDIEMVPSKLPTVVQCAILGPLPMEEWSAEGITTFQGLVLALTADFGGQGRATTTFVWRATDFLATVRGAIEMLEEAGFVPDRPAPDHFEVVLDNEQMDRLIQANPPPKEPDVGNQT